MATLAEIRAKLTALDARRSGNSNDRKQSASYPFWNLQTDQSAKFRFLPDGNDDNTFFWTEKKMINLTFPGVKGGDETKEITIRVPCVETWPGETCPILTETRPWWNDPSLEDLARKYWIKRTYMFQGFVQDDPIGGAEDLESPIRTFSIGPQIFKVVKAALLDPEIENNPTDYMTGLDFTVTKGQKGQWADYSTSKWARKETALTEAQLEALEKHGLQDLNELLPKKPTPAHVNAMFEMFEASVAGELYDPDQWAQYYRPYGMEYEKSSAPTDTPATKATEPVVETDDIPFDMPAETKVEEKAEPEAVVEESSDSSDGKSAQDILAMIRNRNVDA